VGYGGGEDYTLYQVDEGNDIGDRFGNHTKPEHLVIEKKSSREDKKEKREEHHNPHSHDGHQQRRIHLCSPSLLCARRLTAMIVASLYSSFS